MKKQSGGPKIPIQYRPVFYFQLTILPSPASRKCSFERFPTHYEFLKQSAAIASHSDRWGGWAWIGNEFSRALIVYSVSIMRKSVCMSFLIFLQNQVWQCDWRMEIEGLLTDGGSESEIISALQEKVSSMWFSWEVYLSAHVNARSRNQVCIHVWWTPFFSEFCVIALEHLHF